MELSRMPPDWPFRDSIRRVASRPHDWCLIDAGEGQSVSVISLEDIIADRMGQFASGSAPTMFAQAKELFDLYPTADIGYMESRIRYETAGEYGIDTLKD